MATDEQPGAGDHCDPSGSRTADEQPLFPLTGPAVVFLGMLVTAGFLAVGSQVVGWPGMAVGPGLIGVGAFLTWLAQRAARRQVAVVPPSVGTGGDPAPAPLGMTAAEMLRRVDALSRADAQWPEIWAELNPDDSPAVRQLLADFRGPYLLAPHAALNVLRIGCERALADSPAAHRVDAIRAAMQADDQIVRPR